MKNYEFRKKPRGAWEPCTEEQALGMKRTAAFRRKFEVREVDPGSPTPSARKKTASKAPAKKAETKDEEAKK